MHLSRPSYPLEDNSMLLSDSSCPVADNSVSVNRNLHSPSYPMADNPIHFCRPSCPLADNSMLLSDSSCPVADNSETGQLGPDNSGITSLIQMVYMVQILSKVFE